MEVEVVKELEVNMEQIGPQGYSAYELYVKNGGTLSETEWLASLKGDTGEKGDKGDTGSVKFIVVTDLPTENIDTDAIYIKPIQDPQEQNTYEEFIYVNNKWESLGTPKVEVDLSNYYNKEEANNLFDNKVDKVDGKGLSTNDYTTEEKNKLAGIDLSTKQDTLTAGDNITIENNIISASGGGSSIPIVDIGNKSMTSSYILTDNNERLQMSEAIQKSTENGTKRGFILILGNDELSLMNIQLSGTSNNRPNYSFLAYGSKRFKYSESRVFYYDGYITLNTDYTFYDAKRSNLAYMCEKDDVLTKTNTKTYTPTSDYNPATKKYVDDSLKSFVPTPEVYMVVNENSLNQMTITDESTLETVSNAINQIKNNKGAIILFTFGSITRATYVGIIQPHNLTDTGAVVDLINSAGMYGTYYDIRVTGTTTNNVFTATKLQIMKWASGVAGVGQVLTKTNTESYTPTSNYHPATKKYVDDAIASLKAELTGGTE